MKNKKKKAKSFTKGGLVMGAAMKQLKSGKPNPEIVAPLDKLSKLLNKDNDENKL